MLEPLLCHGSVQWDGKRQDSPWGSRQQQDITVHPLLGLCLPATCPRATLHVGFLRDQPMSGVGAPYIPDPHCPYSRHQHWPLWHHRMKV